MNALSSIQGFRCSYCRYESHLFAAGRDPGPGRLCRPADFSVVSRWPRRQRNAKLELTVNGAKVSLAYDVPDTRSRPRGAFKC